MLRELYSNAAATTVATTINSSLTSLVLTDASTFPLANFRVLVESEIMFCTSRSSNTLTVVRGVEGTTGAGHSSGVAANAIITAGSFDAFRKDMFAAMGHGRVPTSGNTYGDEFDDENFSGWTAVNSGGSPVPTVIEQDKFCSMILPSGGSGNQYVSYMKSCGSRSAGDWISCCLRMHGMQSQYPQGGLWFADGVTYGSGNQFGMQFSVNELLYVMRSNTGYNSQVNVYTAGPNQYQALAYDIHMKVVYQGSTYDGYCSIDGVTWMQIFSGKTTSNSFTPTYCGITGSIWGASTPTTFSFRNFRTSF